MTRINLEEGWVFGAELLFSALIAKKQTKVKHLPDAFVLLASGNMCDCPA